MTIENFPPLRIRENDGDPNVIPVYDIILSSNLQLLNKGAGVVSILATTGAGGSSTVYAPTGGEYLVYSANADLSAERIVTASDNITIVSSGTSFLISATTSDISGKQDTITYPLGVNSGGTGKTVAGSASALVGINSDGLVYDFFYLRASDNTTLVRTGTNILISATTNPGIINTGSAAYLTYYPASGTTVDDTTISVSTGAGVAPFNVTILTSPVASIASGDVWIVSSNNVIYLGVRSSSTNYFVSLAS